MMQTSPANEARRRSSVTRPSALSLHIGSPPTSNAAAAATTTAYGTRDFALFSAVTVAYFVYRSQGAPTFTLEPFTVRANDLYGALFFAAFVLTRRRAYLVYAINPMRNGVLVCLQYASPGGALATETVQSEFWRDVLSAAFQMLCGGIIAYSLLARPFAPTLRHLLDTGSAAPTKHTPAHKRNVDFLLYFQAGACFCYALSQHTTGFTVYDSLIWWKFLLAVVLGVAEEITWREAFMADTSWTLQAFVWGVNHLVVGEGMSSPWLYGLLAALYAMVLGSTEDRYARYASHIAIEFVVMDRLIHSTT